MKLSATRDVLLKPLQAVIGVVERRQTMPILSNVLLVAKEGELARTLLAFESVVRARVHIANTSRRPFSRETEPTASVTVSTSSGSLSREQAEAIRARPRRLGSRRRAFIAIPL